LARIRNYTYGSVTERALEFLTPLPLLENRLNML
jgi:hypothetical protein